MVKRLALTQDIAGSTPATSINILEGAARWLGKQGLNPWGVVKGAGLDTSTFCQDIMGAHVPRGRLSFASSMWWVRFPPSPPIKYNGGVAESGKAPGCYLEVACKRARGFKSFSRRQLARNSAVRVSGLHPEGHRFDSCRANQI